MESNDKKDNTDQADTASTSEKKMTTSIFSEDEINAIIKDFVLAWIRGEIKLIFPPADEIYQRFKKEKRPIDHKMASDISAITKSDLIDLIKICAKPTTPDQQKKVNEELFELILHFRCGDRIQGSFTGYSSKDKLEELEEKLNAVNKAFEELYFYVKAKIPDDSVLGKR
ncbi:MAG: hypothetical protein OEY22_08285 [Candidatus Bathyarchaeota archaeon]|nr:hypothetical protein [Candidatus Bathyarchaeota archaeon]